MSFKIKFKKKNFGRNPIPLYIRILLGIKALVYQQSFQVQVLEDPIQDEEGWSYPVKLISKTTKLFGFITINVFYYDR